jgi:nicotinamidase-related amidase
MPIIDPKTSTLVLIDFQARLVPAIDGRAAAIANAARLVEAAKLMGVPMTFTEQNPTRLGPTAPELDADPSLVIGKTSFDASRAPALLDRLPPGRDAIIAGCEAHVCVLQTALGLVEKGRRAFVVSDAIGSRRAESKERAITRMERNGVEIVTTEMVVFEWLGDADHPRFKEAVALIK